MGGGSYSLNSFAEYSKSVGKLYCADTGRVSNQIWHSTSMKDTMNPFNKIRECCNTEEHPNTVPVILALDVTGSMGNACKETAEALGAIMDKLYKKFKDIEICVMGVGDFECDCSPLQVSQFESDVRVAKQLDEIWMEHRGGGNDYESYTAPWFYGLYRTKLDAFDKQGRKGVIITMGDEPLNPDLPINRISEYFGSPEGAAQIGSLETNQLYKDASKKFDIFHIAVDDPGDSYHRNKSGIERTFKPVLGERFKVSTINGLSGTIIDCIEESIKGQEQHLKEDDASANEPISW